MHTTKIARLFAVPALVGLIAPAACTDGGTPGTQVEQETAFDDFFGGALAGGQRETDAATGEPTNCVAEDGGECHGEPGDGYVVDAPVCEAPLAAGAGIAAACQGFCAKITGCLGEPGSAAACASDCAASLTGVRGEGATALFGCFVGASCDAVLAYVGGGEDVAVDEGRTDTPDGDDESGADAAGPFQEPREEQEQRPEDPAEPRPYDDTIEVCLEDLYEAWGTSPIAGREGFCEAVIDSVSACEGGTVVSGGGSVPPSSGSGSAGSSDPDGEDEASFAPREGGGGGDEEPGVPYVPEEDDARDDGYEAGAELCNIATHVMSDAALGRLGTCAQADTCAAQSDCYDDLMVCAPFAGGLLSGGFGGGGRGGDTVDVGEPTEVEPTPAPAPEGDGGF